MNRIAVAKELMKVARDLEAGKTLEIVTKSSFKGSSDKVLERLREMDRMGGYKYGDVEVWDGEDYIATGQPKDCIRDVAEYLEDESGKEASETVRLAKELVAGDEWEDEGTYEFARQVAREIKADRRHGGKVRATGNVVEFTYSPAVLVFIPLRMTLTEFGYGGESESVNGMITSPEQAAFRCPGGFTRTRDPKELWAKAKENLGDIFKRAMAGQ